MVKEVLCVQFKLPDVGNGHADAVPAHGHDWYGEGLQEDVSKEDYVKQYLETKAIKV